MRSSRPKDSQCISQAWGCGRKRAALRLHIACLVNEELEAVQGIRVQVQETVFNLGVTTSEICTQQRIKSQVAWR